MKLTFGTFQEHDKIGDIWLLGWMTPAVGGEGEFEVLVLGFNLSSSLSSFQPFGNVIWSDLQGYGKFFKLRGQVGKCSHGRDNCTQWQVNLVLNRCASV